MASTITARLRHVLFALALLGATGQPTTQEYYYGIELNGVLCGYVTITASPLGEGARTLTLLRHEVVVRGTLLGAGVDNRIVLTYHIDPVTNAFTYHTSRIEQGQTTLTSAVRIEGRTARVSDGRGGPETTVDLPADVVLANTLVQSHLVTDFVAGSADRKTYRLFDGRDNAVREVAYTKTGRERLQLAGRTFDTLVLDVLERSTGVILTVWLDTKTGIVVQTSQPGNRRSYLAGADVVQTVDTAGRRADLNPAVMTKTDASIPAVRRISFMRVRAAMQPTGVWLTPEALNVPGQRFQGTVTNNRVEGVFEIAHPRYDGAGAPAFPADVNRDPALKRFLEADEYIQTNDPVIRAKALEISAGARDAWDAARRLSTWVATHIKGAIPGGVTARGTLDQGAGECGGHSFLFAALCRSVGIPARVVWGCMYTPHEGGAFGQHAWNEVHMGEAGWVPIDTTASETDYVDSGHIRIGIVQSLTTSLNASRFAVLEHRLAPASGPAAAGGTSGATTFDAYLGEFKNTERGLVMNVVDRGGSLTLDIPGRAVFTLKEPDADGAWRSTLSDQVFATFTRDAAGRAVEVRLHQVVRLGRIEPPAAPAADLPDNLRRYPGVYLLAQAQARFTLGYEDGALLLHDPLAKATRRLKPASNAGGWVDESGRFTIWFDTDQAGVVTAMLVDGATVFTR